MRTTLVIDDDVLDMARAQARARGVSVGRAVSDLARRGRARPLTCTMRNGLPVVDVPPDAPRISLETVLRLEDEGE